mmetsp:Transcript_8908/g.27295  ORF Transcript_8908/g.27295 Transcript_8908/m.27295 type:complete len:412 (-) Transcript_8908:63-1298(-)
MSPATSTVTFFRGPPYVAAASLSRRVRQIVAANPWLTSVLERDPDSGLMEAYYHQPSPKPCFEVRADILLASGAAYDEMVRIVDPVVCKTSDASLGTGERLWRVCLIPDADEPDGRFALVVSANHSLLDGHGFYRLHTMLSAGAAVEALNPVRKQELPTRILQASGGEESAMAVCPPGFLARFLFGQLRGALFPSTVHLGFHVDEEWVAARKAEEPRGDSFGTIADGVPFVSTNDVLVSAFLSALKCRCAMMAINFRGKVTGCGEADAGNYEDLMTYMPPDYATPSLIRRSVTGRGGVYTRAAEPRTAQLTNAEHLMGGTYGAVTNWASFAKALSVDGCEAEYLHLPLFDFPKACPACICGSMVIFRPGEGKSVAAMVAGSQALIDAVKASGMVGLPLHLGTQRQRAGEGR